MYINEINVIPGISVNEIFPINVSLKDFDVSDVLTVVEAKRFVLDNREDIGISIISHITVTSNIVIIRNIWNDGETIKAGKYRIRVITKNASGSTKIEFNLIITVLHS